ncbi:unnamed protein product [Gadus morhua 'NCC']
MHAWTKVAGVGPVQTASAICSWERRRQTTTLCVFQTKLKHSFGLLHILNVHWQRQQNHQILSAENTKKTLRAFYFPRSFSTETDLRLDLIGLWFFQARPRVSPRVTMF